MITEIGIVAGEIWQVLDQQGACTLQELCAALERPREIVLMSLGWLCREGHVELLTQDAGYTIRLRSEDEIFEPRRRTFLGSCWRQ